MVITGGPGDKGIFIYTAKLRLAGLGISIDAELFLSAAWEYILDITEQIEFNHQGATLQKRIENNPHLYGDYLLFFVTTIASNVTAYEKANRDITIDFKAGRNGVRINLLRDDESVIAILRDYEC